jgi:hypothetical protein
MQNFSVFLPVVVQMILTMSLFVYLALAKAEASKQGLVNEERRSLHEDAWPDSVLQVNNCVRNQFETPVLFYVLVILLWLTNGVTLYVHIFAWAFVATRIVHALIHVRSNYVPLRRKVFIVGGLNLIALSLLLIYSITIPA